MQDDLYREIILEHWKNPQNYRVLSDNDIDITEQNKSCGDTIRLMIKFKDGKITEIAFLGDGCAISKASASMLTEQIKNMKISSLNKLTQDKVLQNLGLNLTPARMKCALLSFVALKKSLDYYQPKNAKDKK